MQHIKIPTLFEGEIYVGAISDKNRDFYHLILLPGDNDDASWKMQLDWAKSIGGNLPNRIEQAMLWAYCSDQFKKEWYWSNETYQRNDAFAWCQDFGHSDQFTTVKGYYLRARAVRRVYFN